MRAVALTSTFTPEAFAAGEATPHACYADFEEFLEAEGRWLAGDRAESPAW
jgi:hypothetical protein